MNYLIIYIISFILIFCLMIILFRNRNANYKICRNFDWLFSTVETPNQAFWACFLTALFGLIIIIFIPIFGIFFLLAFVGMYILYLMNKLNSHIFNVPFDKTFEEFFNKIG